MLNLLDSILFIFDSNLIWKKIGLSLTEEDFIKLDSILKGMGYNNLSDFVKSGILSGKINLDSRNSIAQKTDSHEDRNRSNELHKTVVAISFCIKELKAELQDLANDSTITSLRIIDNSKQITIQIVKKRIFANHLIKDSN